MKAAWFFFFGMVAGEVLHGLTFGDEARRLGYELGAWTRCQVMGDCVRRGLQ